MDKKENVVYKTTVMPLAMKAKKFYCSCCGEKLIPYPRTRILKRGDPDYKKHSHIGRGRRVIGDIELTEYDFKCLSCDKFISYDEQCVIREIQKCVGARMLSEDNINDNYEKANENLKRKTRVRSIICRLLGTAVAVLILYFWFRSGNSSLQFYF